MGEVYVYVVDRDFGFAPNPFHGVCSLATCKPRIRNKAVAGDWIVGLGGARMKATGRCVFAMNVTNVISFNEYWNSPEFRDKKPVRNGSNKMMVGDNIYHCDLMSGNWHQADSHHSNFDGTVNPHNLKNDTQTNKVLLSEHFFYFGKDAPRVPDDFFHSTGFKNGIGHRRFTMDKCRPLFDWLYREYGADLNCVRSDPFYFDESEKRYSVKGNKIL